MTKKVNILINDILSVMAVVLCVFAILEGSYCLRVENGSEEVFSFNTLIAYETEIKPQMSNFGVFIIVFAILFVLVTIFNFVSTLINDDKNYKMYSYVALGLNAFLLVIVLICLLVVINTEAITDTDFTINISKEIYSEGLCMLLVVGVINLFVTILSLICKYMFNLQQGIDNIDDYLLDKDNEEKPKPVDKNQEASAETILLNEINEMKKQLELKKLKEEYNDLLKQLNDK